MTPTKEEVHARATEMFIAEKNGNMEGESVSLPEDCELREGGYLDEARRDLMSEDGTFGPGGRETAVRRLSEVEGERSSLREILGLSRRKRPRGVLGAASVSDDPGCALHKHGAAIILYVPGFDPVAYQSKSFDYDLGMLEAQLREWRVPEPNPYYDKLLADLQAAWGRGGQRNDRLAETVAFWDALDQCYDAVKAGGAGKFLTWADGEYSLLDTVDSGGGFDLLPIQWSKNRYELEGEALSAPPSLSDLYARTFAFFDSYWAHPDPRAAKFLALYVMHSYILPRSNGTIFVWLVGRKRSGKTTAEMLCAALGYRAIYGVNPSEAAVYRMLGCVSEGAFMVVVGEYERASDFMREIVREGDIPGQTVPRAEKDEAGRFGVRQYFVYGSRVVASNALHGDEADMDRYLVLKCLTLKPKRPRAELYQDREVKGALAALRRDLLLWKVAAWPTLRFPVQDPSGEMDGRDWDHYGGMLSLAAMVNPRLEDEMRGFVLEYLKEGEAESSESAPALLLEAVESLAIESNRDLEGTADYYVPFAKIWDELKSNCTPFVEDTGMESGTKVVTPGGQVLSKTKAGRILKDQLLGRPVRKPGGKERGYFWSEKTLASLRPRTVTGVTAVTGSQGKHEQTATDTEGHEADGSLEPGGAALQPERVTPVTPVTKTEPTLEDYP